MGISITSNNRFKQITNNLKRQKDKKLLIGIMEPEIATIGMYLEYGWVQSVTKKQNSYLNSQLGYPQRNFSTLSMPPRPFMRSTFSQKNKEWSELFKKYFVRDFDIDKALGIVLVRAIEDVQQTIIDAGIPAGSFPKRSPLTMEILKARGEMKKAKKIQKGQNLPANVLTDKPLELSGRLLHSITGKII